MAQDNSGHQVATRYHNGMQQVIFFRDSVPVHTKAFPESAVDSFTHAVMDWTRDGQHYEDEYTTKLVDVTA